MSSTSILEATHLMVKAWVEEVEQRKLDPLQEGPTKEKRATRQRSEKPSRPQVNAASGQKGSPKRARLKAGSTKHDSSEN